MISLKVHHYGFLTDDIAKSIEAYRKLGYTQRSRTTDHQRKIEIVFVATENDDQIELIMPIAEDSVVSKLMGKLKNSIYHTCYLAEDLDGCLRELRSLGFMMIDPPTPAIALQNRRVAFLYSRHAGMIEILES